MVFAPDFQELKFDGLAGLEDAIKQQQKAMKAVQQFPFEQVIAMRKAMNQIQPAFQKTRQISGVLSLYRNQLFAAREAAIELAHQKQQIQEALRKAQSAFKTVQQFSPQQWAALAGLTGVSVTTSMPFWMSVSGVAAPASQLPTVTLSEIATVLAGEANYAAAVAMDIATHRIEAVINDESLRTVATYLIAGLVSLVVSDEKPIQNMKNLVFWAILIVNSLAAFFLSD